MKNVYFVQPNNVYGGEICLPYAPGAIAAYAFSKEEIKKAYTLKKLIYRKQEPESYVLEMEEPAVVAFSCYVWNFEHCRASARVVKERYPDCRIVFGGHSVSDEKSDLLESSPFIDFLIHEEGEVPFYRLLLALENGSALSGVPNLSYRENGETRKTANEVFPVEDFPSPYTAGLFDGLLAEGADRFYGIFETNRGCPFDCVYCDWAKRAAKVRLFPMGRVMGDIKWLSDHKIGYCVSADANFGMFERDLEICDALIAAKRESGYPARVQFCFTKNSDDRVFEINRRMNKWGISKGATISLQTLSEEALSDVGRKNMPFDRYVSLVRRYNEAGISTYTDMILGLPGETYDSFTRGIGMLLDAGQHSNVNVFNCELLINSRLGSAEYKEKFGIKTAPCALNRHHSALSDNEVTEANAVVTETTSMPACDWVKSNLFVAAVGSMHNLGLLQMFALYLHTEKGQGYADFYKELINLFLYEKPQSAPGRVFTKLSEMLTDVTTGKGDCRCYLPRYGNVNWPAEEWCFLQITEYFDEFYETVGDFLREKTGDEKLYRELLAYQKSIIKLPGRKKLVFDVDYDFPAYFSAVTCGREATLENRAIRVEITDENAIDDPATYARETVWYGRKGGRNFYRDEIRVTPR